VIPCKWIEVQSFSEGLAAVEAKVDGFKYDYEWGYIDKTGTLVIPCKWDSAYPFSKGVATVFDGKFHSINKQGEIVE
jgi:hypothetical protein